MFRPVVALAALLVVGVVGGGLLAPHAFHALLWLGRHVIRFEALRELEFEQVAYRCVMVVTALGLWPALRCGGMASWRSVGLIRTPHALRHLLGGFTLGVLSLGLLVAVGWAWGAYTQSPVAPAQLAGRALMLLAGAVFVGVVEEVFFRGVVFGALRPLGLAVAALLSAAFYSVLHFAKPESQLGVVHADWDRAFALLPHLLESVSPAPAPWVEAATLGLIGLILALLYERAGHLYRVMGLHAGWVWIVQFALSTLERRPEVLPALFGGSRAIVRSPAALLMASAFLLVVILARRRPGKT